MQRITFNLAASATIYVPVPVRGTVSGAHASFQATVTASNLITFTRATSTSDATALTVNLITAETTAAKVREDGVRDTTNMDLVFDPVTAAFSCIKVVASGGNAVAAVVTIEYDDSAAITQESTEA